MIRNAVLILEGFLTYLFMIAEVGAFLGAYSPAYFLIRKGLDPMAAFAISLVAFVGALHYLQLALFRYIAKRKP